MDDKRRFRPWRRDRDCPKAEPMDSPRPHLPRMPTRGLLRCSTDGSLMEEISAADSCRARRIRNACRPILDQSQLEPLQGRCCRALPTSWQRACYARQNRSWEFDREEGILDARPPCRGFVARPDNSAVVQGRKKTPVPRYRCDAAAGINFGPPCGAARFPSQRSAPTSLAVTPGNACDVEGREFLGFLPRKRGRRPIPRGLAETVAPPTRAPERICATSSINRRRHMAPDPAHSGPDD